MKKSLILFLLDNRHPNQVLPHLFLDSNLFHNYPVIVKSTVCSVKYAAFSVQCAVFIMKSAVCSLKCALFSVQPAV